MNTIDTARLIAGTILMGTIAILAAVPLLSQEPKLTIDDILDAALPPEETEETEETLDKTAFWPYTDPDAPQVQTVRAVYKITPAPEPTQAAPVSSYSPETTEVEETLTETEKPAETRLSEPDEQPPCMAGNDHTGTAARIVASATPEERDMLARIARAECGGESVQSMACIVAMVANRVADPHFPGTIREVIESPGQFKPVELGTYYQPASAAAVQAVDMVAAGYDPSFGATYFSTGRSAWHWQALQYLGTFEKIYLYHEWE